MLCNICKRPLTNDPDSDAYDCGGDCVRCMADIFEDPECVEHMNRLRGKDKDNG